MWLRETCAGALGLPPPWGHPHRRARPALGKTGSRVARSPAAVRLQSFLLTETPGVAATTGPAGRMSACGWCHTGRARGEAPVAALASRF